MSNKISFIFPGQGSQFVGMFSEYAERFPELLETYKEASDVLGYDVWQLTQQGPKDKLNQTEYSQPALLTAEIALWRVLKTILEYEPLFLAGHSLGEYSALVCAGSIDFQDAVWLVSERGKLMQQAVPPGEGGMVAIVGLDESKIKEVCTKAAQGKVLSPANFNSIGQTVLSGNFDAVKRAVNIAKELGAKLAVLLQVSVPSHCILMESAAEKLGEKLKNVNIGKPKIPVISNVDVRVYSNGKDIREKLVQQLYSPVQWVKTIQFLNENSLDYLVECGPGKVLAGLNKRIEKGLITKAPVEVINLMEA